MILTNKQSNEASLFENITRTLLGEKDIQKSVIFGCSNNNQENSLIGASNKSVNSISGFNNNNNIGEGLLTPKNNGDKSVESNNDNQKIEAGLFSKTLDNINFINNNNFSLSQNNNEVINQENTSLKIPRNNIKKFIPKVEIIAIMKMISPFIILKE